MKARILLKDAASAAVYGIRAAAGVMLITTIPRLSSSEKASLKGGAYEPTSIRAD